MIKISILKDGDNYAYMEYQTGNDPLIFDNTYGDSGFTDKAEVLESILRNYEGKEIILTDNTK